MQYARKSNSGNTGRALRETRDALEAAFQPAAVPGQSTQPRVVVKRRRMLVGPKSLEAMPVEAGQGIRQGPSPRVHRLERVQAGLSPGDSPDGVAVGLASAGGSGLSAAKGRRRRRVLHGEVTTVYVTGNSPAPAPQDLDRADEQVPPRAQRTLQGSVRSTAQGFVAPASLELRRLLRQIAQLELQAEKARRREARDVIEWIKSTMTRYGIRLSELTL